MCGVCMSVVASGEGVCAYVWRVILCVCVCVWFNIEAANYMPSLVEISWGVILR